MGFDPVDQSLLILMWGFDMTQGFRSGTSRKVWEDIPI